MAERLFHAADAGRLPDVSGGISLFRLGVECSHSDVLIMPMCTGLGTAIPAMCRYGWHCERLNIPVHFLPAE